MPVLYHDFFVCISMKKKKDAEENEMLQLPLKDLSLEQLHLLKVFFYFACIVMCLDYTFILASASLYFKRVLFALTLYF